MIKAILFDLDGTLLPMKQEEFIKAYFGGLTAHAEPYGYNKEKLSAVIWAGTEKMVKNDGSHTNEEIFWNHFASIYGDAALSDSIIFDDFYKDSFEAVRSSCGYTAMARQAIDFLKARKVRIILATNPVFPYVATHQRIVWAGLTPSDFEYISTYENSSYCKPNPKYYREILNKCELCAEECIMVGNDVNEDMIAKDLGMQVFLLTDNLINRANTDINSYPHGSFDDLYRYFLSML